MLPTSVKKGHTSQISNGSISMQLDTKHKVLVNLLKIQLSSEFSDIVESL